MTACILSSLAGTIGSMVDGVVIGQYLGSDSIAAFGVINPLLTVFSIFGAVFATGSDIAFDLLVVLMHGDTFEMGLATSLSYYMAVAVLLTHFRKKNILLHFSIRNIQWKDSIAIIGMGAPSGVCRLGNTLRSAWLNPICSR